MSKVIKLISGGALLKVTLFCLSFLSFQLFIYSQEAPLDGAKIFKANCAACHSVGTNKLVGPGLQGINDKYTREWLGKWIVNSPELIASGDADAQAIFAEYNNLPMPPQAVNEKEIDAILAYIQNPSTGEDKGEDIAEKDNVVEVVDN